MGVVLSAFGLHHRMPHQFLKTLWPDLNPGRRYLTCQKRHETWDNIADRKWVLKERFPAGFWRKCWDCLQQESETMLGEFWGLIGGRMRLENDGGSYWKVNRKHKVVQLWMKAEFQERKRGGFCLVLNVDFLLLKSYAVGDEFGVDLEGDISWIEGRKWREIG
ncbi:hypothetical protein Fot_24771 [Forsythia ovata]|uniref:Uncharacterized protein n=1 Tax=Forsythia ovata TaxID=205694 RepID=A0ABD1U881_9LAMI